MNKLLERYLKHITKSDYIEIGYFNIDGAICYVEYYTTEGYYYKDKDNINVWDMLVFLNDN